MTASRSDVHPRGRRRSAGRTGIAVRGVSISVAHWRSRSRPLPFPKHSARDSRPGAARAQTARPEECSARRGSLPDAPERSSPRSKAEPGAALLGRKIRQKEPLAGLRSQAVTGVGDYDLGHVVFAEASLNRQLPQQAALHRFGGIVDQVGERALQRLGVGHHWRNVRRQPAAMVMPPSRPAKSISALSTMAYSSRSASAARWGIAPGRRTGRPACAWFRPSPG
jgi:hypothetical protein